MIVDSHLHLWLRARGDYDWLPQDGGPLDRDFEATDAWALLQASWVQAAILVQAAPTIAETKWLLELAKHNSWIAGIVGWADLTRPSISDDLTALRALGPLVGVRPMLQDEPDSHWLSRADTKLGLHALTKAGLTFDALVRPHQLTALTKMAMDHQNLKIVLDHGGKPPMTGTLVAWLADLRVLARLENVYCKVSGLLSETKNGWDQAHFVTIIDTLLEIFGPTRLMWGSDWPVCTQAIQYRTSFELVFDLLKHRLSEKEIGAIFGKNATQFYGLKISGN